MKKLFVPPLAAVALLATGAAQAGNVAWSVGITLPAVTTVVSNLPPPVYAPPAVVVAPPPVVYLPAPVVYRPAPVVWGPAPVVYVPRAVVRAPRPVVYAPVPGWVPHGHWRKHRHGDRDD